MVQPLIEFHPYEQVVNVASWSALSKPYLANLQNVRFVPDIKGTSWTATDIFAQEGKAWCVPTSSYLLSFLKSLHDLGNDIPISKENNLPIEITAPFGIRGEELGQTIDCEYPFDVSISKSGTARVTFTEEQANSIRKGIGILKELLPDIS